MVISEFIHTERVPLGQCDMKTLSGRSPVPLNASV